MAKHELSLPVMIAIVDANIAESSQLAGTPRG